ncbi:hypothetical protein EDB86DRAFT_3246624 [Lactarius hatsudake]|nr:hypothetical protein EDB86DRAFT_3246624 [Lactarius hatsudake]
MARQGAEKANDCSAPCKYDRPSRPGPYETWEVKTEWGYGVTRTYDGNTTHDPFKLNDPTKGRRGLYCVARKVEFDRQLHSSTEVIRQPEVHNSCCCYEVQSLAIFHCDTSQRHHTSPMRDSRGREMVGQGPLMDPFGYKGIAHAGLPQTAPYSHPFSASEAQWRLIVAIVLSTVTLSGLCVEIARVRHGVAVHTYIPKWCTPVSIGIEGASKGAPPRPRRALILAGVVRLVLGRARVTATGTGYLQEASWVPRVFSESVMVHEGDTQSRTQAEESNSG